MWLLALPFLNHVPFVQKSELESEHTYFSTSAWTPCFVLPHELQKPCARCHPNRKRSTCILCAAAVCHVASALRQPVDSNVQIGMLSSSLCKKAEHVVEGCAMVAAYFALPHPLFQARLASKPLHELKGDLLGCSGPHASGVSGRRRGGCIPVDERAALTVALERGAFVLMALAAPCPNL